MDALGKLKKLTNPQWVEGYGVSVSLSELMKSDEDKVWVQRFFYDYVPVDKCPDDIKEIVRPSVDDSPYVGEEDEKRGAQTKKEKTTHE